MKRRHRGYVLLSLIFATIIIIFGGRWKELLSITFVMIVAAVIEELQGWKR
jgi:hypothetical protein